MTADTTAPGTGLLSGPAEGSLTGPTGSVFEFFGVDNATPATRLTFECSLDGTPFAACSSPADAGVLAPGAHTFAVRAVDLAGNPDSTPATRSWTVVAAPTTVVTSGPSSPHTTESAIFVFAASQPGSTFECSLNDSDFTACTSPYAARNLVDGTQVLEIVATNPQGVAQEPPTVYTWSVELGPDTVSPDTTIIAGPPVVDQNSVATFTFTGSDNRSDFSFECALDGTAYNSCTSPQQFSDLQRGVHIMRVRTIDGAGNVDLAPAIHEWAVSPPPQAVIVSGPAEFTESADATFTFVADVPGATFECWLDGVQETCSSPHSYSGLDIGHHYFAVLVTDPLGSVATQWEEHEWVITHVTAPVTVIESGPGIQTEDPTAVLVFSTSSPGTDFRCSLDGAQPAPCASPRTYPNLPAGPHTFEVHAIHPTVVDQFGLPVEPFYEPLISAREWTVIDVIAPDTEIGFGPPATTASTIATFGVSSTDPAAILECSLDLAPFTECESPAIFEGLSFGSHTLLVRSVDAAGNVDPTPASRQWTIITPAPNTPVGTNVRVAIPLTGAGTAEVTFAEVFAGGATIIEPANGGPALPGGYSIAGGGFLEISTTADYSEPVTVCLPYEPSSFGTTAVRLLHFDGSLWTDITVTNEPVGGWVCGQPEGFSLFAIAGGTGVAPLASVTSGPDVVSTTGTASFTFVADVADASFLCSLDGLPFEGCTSPVTYTHLENGSHTFQVQAVGAGGSPPIDPQLLPAYEWEVILGPDTVAPNTTILTGPPSLSASAISVFTFTGSDNQSLDLDLEFECSLDGVVFGLVHRARAVPGRDADRRSSYLLGAGDRHHG